MPNSTRIININVTFRNMAPSDVLRERAQEKVGNCLQKFARHDTEANVTLKVEKNSQIAEVSTRTNGADFACSESSNDMYASIDALVDVLTQQLRKHKDRLTDHHSKEPPVNT